MTTRDRLKTDVELVVQAINQNTRAILATARLLSERLPGEPEPVRSVVTQEDSERAYRSRLGALFVAPEGTRPANDRDLLESALSKARAYTDEVSEGEETGDCPAGCVEHETCK